MIGRPPKPKPSPDLFDDLPDPMHLVAQVFSGLADRVEIPSYTEFSKTIKIPSRNDPNDFSYYDPASDRVQELWLGLLDDNEYTQYIWCAPPQIGGKTLVAVMVPTMRDLFARKVAVGYGLPTGTDIRKSYADKLKPSIEESGFGGYMPETGPGARGGQAPSIRFEDRENNEMLGRLIFLTMDAYSSTVQTAIVDELDQFYKAGEPYRQGMTNVFSRSASSGKDALNIGCGTVEHDSGSLLLSEIRAGTHFRLAHKCPQCDGYFRAEFETEGDKGSRLMYTHDEGEAAAAASARYVCGASGCILDDDDRKEAISNGELIGKDQEWIPGEGIVGPINERNCSLITNALDCVRGDLGEIAVKEFLAKKAIDEYDDHSAMRMFHRYVRCEEYTGDTDADMAGLTMALTRQGLAAKSKASKYAVGEIPEGFTYCTLGIDVQKTRCYHLLTAHSKNQSADTSYGYEEFCEYKKEPTEQQICDGLDRAIDNALELCTDQERLLAGVAVDFGYNQPLLLRWWKNSPHADIIQPIKGVGDLQADRMEKGSSIAKKRDDKPGVYYIRQQAQGFALLFVDTEPMRERMQSGYRQDPEANGSNLVPYGIKPNDYLFQHLTSWEIEYDKNGRKKWVKVRNRDDFLDCRAYSEALNVRLRELTDTSYEFAPDAAPDQIDVMATVPDDDENPYEFDTKKMRGMDDTGGYKF